MILKASIVAVVASSCLFSVEAFAPPRVISTRLEKQTFTNNYTYIPPLSVGPPIISDWRYKTDGSISGIVTNHPSIPDGDMITTSPIKDKNAIDENKVVQTKSGSKYKLGNVAWGATIPRVEFLNKERKIKAAAQAEVKVEKERSAQEQKAKNAAAVKTTEKAKSAAKQTPKAVKTEPKQPSAAELSRLAKSKFSLTGTTVGDQTKYLLAGKPRQSSGRAAKIWTAYIADENNPTIPAGFDGDESKILPLTIKLSPDVDRMRLENVNYNKVQSGLFIGRFVKKIDYVEYIASSDRSIDRKVCALVIESGLYDLKALLSARQGEPLRGRALRDAAAAAGQCIQAVHSSGLVWTDLKTENFIVVGNDNKRLQEVNDGTGGRGLPGVKGIDLESVIPRGENPIDYSPEACPPEFAKAFMAGEGSEFVLDYSYDIWSLGMMLYELSTGKAYFDRRSPSQVTKLLCSETFEADVSAVPDGKLKDLISKCLSLDPKKRPDVIGFLLHPFFITSGIGPISF